MSFNLVSGSVILVLLISISSIHGVSQCVCPRHSAPVCGSDGQVYINRCLLDCTKSIMMSDIQVTKEGPCDLPAAPAQAPIQCACSKNLSPVCGTDGVTYNNVCLLRCARLKNYDLEVQAEGYCGLKRSKRMLYESRYNMHRRYPCSFE